nr:putative cytokinetic ring protein SteA [Saccharopolyspora rectivirgula]
MGTARVQRDWGDFQRRLCCRDIAVINQPDLSRRTAELLVATGVQAVVNAAESISGRYPVSGPDVLLAAGVTLVDGVGERVLREVRDGTRIRLHEGRVHVGEQVIASGVEQTRETIAELRAAAKAQVVAQFETFCADTVEFFRVERQLLLDGDGVPELSTPMAGRHVLVVAPGPGRIAELRRLKEYIREHRPVLVGVQGGAELLCTAGYRPDVVVADPDRVSAGVLTCGAEIVVPAQLDGYAPGLRRTRQLGVGAVTFPAISNPEDMALLLAEQAGAKLVVTVGFPDNLTDVLSCGRERSYPSTVLTRLRLGGRAVDAAAVVQLQRNSPPAVLVLLVVFAVLVVSAAVVVVGAGPALLHPLAWFGDSAAAYFDGLLGQ